MQYIVMTAIMAILAACTAAGMVADVNDEIMTVKSHTVA